VLRRDQSHVGVDQFLLGVEDVERGALTARASSRTPLSAISAASTCAVVASICALAAYAGEARCNRVRNANRHQHCRLNQVMTGDLKVNCRRSVT
jgi:hypothetical protein